MAVNQHFQYVNNFFLYKLYLAVCRKSHAYRGGSQKKDI